MNFKNFKFRNFYSSDDDDDSSKDSVKSENIEEDEDFNSESHVTVVTQGVSGYNDSRICDVTGQPIDHNLQIPKSPNFMKRDEDDFRTLEPQNLSASSNISGVNTLSHGNITNFESNIKTEWNKCN